MDGNRALHNLLNGSLPFRRVGLSGNNGRFRRIIHLLFDIVDRSVGGGSITGGQNSTLGPELFAGTLRGLSSGAALALGTQVKLTIHLV